MSAVAGGIASALQGINAEPLTIAYVGIGAIAEWNKRTEAERAFIAEKFEGQLGYVEAVIEHSAMLDIMANIAGDLPGVFAYEIAEDFGVRFGRALFDGEDLLHDTHKLADGIGRALFREMLED